MITGGSFSHYRILKKIGQGGLGEVFVAEDTILNRKVALKFLSTETEKRADIRARFLLEARSAAAIDHPFVCKVYETGEVEGHGFIAMEFVEGYTLAERLNTGSLAVNEALTIAIEIAEGVAAAHEREIVHRDLKPANIMISIAGHVKIMDFGLAKQIPQVIETLGATAAAGFETADQAVLGTPAYMSPEQIRGERADPRSDVFAMGLVYFQAFSGKHPFLKQTVQATMAAILYEDAPILGSIAPHLPENLSEILRKMLMKDPAGRYPSSRELRDDLMRLRNATYASAALVSTREALTAVSVKPASPPAIAILPFVDLSPARDQEYFCDGLAEELITALSRLRELKVASRISSFRFRGTNLDLQEIRDRLKVTTVLEGSVRKAGDKIRVVVKLVDAETGYPLWTDRYDRSLVDVFEIQDEIAQSVVERLKVTITSTDIHAAEKPRENIVAYEHYLKGRYYWNKRTEESLQRSIEFFEKALAEEPNYELAHAGLAEACVTLALYGAVAPSETMHKARSAAERALSQRPDLAEALTALACIRAVYDWNWTAAENDFKHVISAHPKYAGAHQWYAINCLVPLGRFAEAHAAVREALAIEPLSLAMLATAGLVSFYERDYDAAIEQYRKCFELDPEFAIAHSFLGQAYAEKKLFDRAIPELERAVELTNRSPECVAALGYVAALSGDRERAESLMAELQERSRERYVSPVLVAWVAVGLGNYEKAFQALNQAVQMRAADLVWLGVRPAFDGIRLDARFEGLRAKMRV